MERFSVLIFCAAARISQAQQRVTGTVSDSNGVPLLGVDVIQRNTTNGTTSDFGGRFEIGTTTEKSCCGL